MSRYINREQLRQAISEAFSDEELRTLCFALAIEYDDLPATGRGNRIRELVALCDRANRLPDLVAQCQEMRPNRDWQTVSDSLNESPYKGLHHYDVNDASLFFGRERVTKELVEHLRQHRFLAVVGASGSGKSSVVQAGMIPALQQGMVEINGQSSQHWLFHIMTPGNNPLRALAVTLTRDVESVTAAETLEADLHQSSKSLDLFLYRQIAEHVPAHLLLVIDQFEELFTQCDDPETRRLLVENLITVLNNEKQDRLTLILTLRADFYSQAVQLEELRPLLQTQQKIVGPMNQEELRAAIERPAKKTGWLLQPGLIETILQDVGHEPGGLPLLSHALKATWERRDGRTLTLGGYQAAGGVQQAIAHAADNVYDNLTLEQRTIAWAILSRLVQISESSHETRRQASFLEFSSEQEQTDSVQTVLDILVQRRLIITNDAKDTNYELIHEALIENWPRFKEWLKSNKEGLIARNQLSAIASVWEENERHEDFLVAGKQLELFEKWCKSAQIGINSIEKGFLDASRTKIRQKKRNWLLMVSFLSSLVLIVLYMLFLFHLGPFTPTWMWTNGPIGGDTWVPAVDPNAPTEIYIGYAHQGIYKTLDEGESWFPSNTGLSTSLVNNLIIEPKSNTVFAIVDRNIPYQSQDGGINWIPISEGLPLDVIVRDMDIYSGSPAQLYLATWQYGIWSTPIDEIAWQQKTWLGLESPSIHQVRIAEGDGMPTVIYATSSFQGLFRSFDLGETWEHIAFSEGDITQIDIAPWNKEIIYIYDATSGSYVSQDGGQTWLPIANQLIQTPRSWPYFYEDGQSKAIFVSTYNGQVFRSNEIGTDWQPVWENLPLATIRGIRILPNTKNILLSTSNGIYLSKDDGYSWRLTGPEVLSASAIINLPNELETGILIASQSGIYKYTPTGSWEVLNGGLGELRINKLFISDQSLTPEIYAISDERKLYRFLLDENRWQPFPLPPEIRVTSIATQLNGPFSMLTVSESNQIYHTSDIQTWRKVWEAPSMVADILASPQLPETFYAITLSNGVYRSTDSGITWRPINNGLTNSTVNDLAASVNDETLLYAATNDGIFVSRDGGLSWNRSNVGLSTPLATVVALHPIFDSMVYAGTLGGVFVSYNYGETWQAIDKGLNVRDISSLSANEHFVYAGTSQGIYYIEHPVIPTLHWKQ